MPMLKPPRTVSRRQELRQDAVFTGYTKAIEGFEKYRTYIIGAGILALVLVFVWIGYSLYQNNQNEHAAEALGGIVRLYEQGQYRQALDGTPQQIGLLEIADQYGSTRDGNLARFYAADALFRLGEKEQALAYFEAYDKGDDYIGASAYAGEAAVHADLGHFEEAAELYEQAAEAYPNPITSPDYLLQAARNYVEAGSYDQARDLYEQIKEDYPDAPASANVDLLIARLNALSS